MYVIAILVSHAQSAILEEPSERGLDHPSKATEATTMLSVSSALLYSLSFSVEFRNAVPS